jgi:hypothetical protein
VKKLHNMQSKFRHNIYSRKKLSENLGHFCNLKISCPKQIIAYVIGRPKIDKSVANPTVVSYNASAVNINNATSSLVRFENKNIC